MTQLRYLRRGAQTIVTWRPGGHTVLSGAGISPGEVIALAAWSR